MVGAVLAGASDEVGEAVEKIAALPSREELIAKLLGTIQNPLQQIVRVLNGPMESFARVVSAIEDQKNAA